MSTSEHERIGAVIASHERASSLAAASHEELAEKARDRKKRDMDAHINAPAHARGRMAGVHDDAIAYHSRQALVHRRRAEIAAAGFVQHGPDEYGDVEYMRGNQELIGMARRTGRLRQTEDKIDQNTADKAEINADIRQLKGHLAGYTRGSTVAGG